MNKTKLVRFLARDMGLSLGKARILADNMFGIIADSLAAGIPVTLQGFGRWDVRDVAEHQGRNPQTGEPLTIAAGRRVRFIAADRLRARVNP